MSLFKFANPDILYLLLLLPVMVVLWIINNIRRKKAFLKLGNPDLVSGLMPELSLFRPNLKMLLGMVALSLLIVVVARPQFGSKLEEVK